MSGTMFDLVGDLTCVLQDAQVDQAVCIGFVHPLSYLHSVFITHLNVDMIGALRCVMKQHD